MRDPFPIPPIPALTKAVEPWCEKLSFKTLPLHIHEVLITAMFYLFIQKVVSPIISTRLFSKQYKSLSRGKKLNWDVHVVSLVQSTMINGLALWIMFVDEERKNMDWQERVFGYSGGSAMIVSLAAGYFLYDLIITVSDVSVFGVGMLAHAISALTVYSFGFRPFVNYYSTNFILWELSSPFLNIHWMCDKLGLTGSKLQLYNGFILIGTFFSCRLVWGTWQSVMVFKDIWAALNNELTMFPASLKAAQNVTLPAQYEKTMGFVTESSSVPLWLAVVYMGANITLNSLNFYWFVKMIDAVRKRFTPKKEEKKEKTEVDGQDGKAVASGVNVTPELKLRPRTSSFLDGEGHGDEPPPGI